ncbi:MAG: hypothetical protein ACLPY1_22610 [Terracidiphilus sp.]
MKNSTKRFALTLMAAAALAVAAHADDLSLTLTPASGTVSGAPGQAVGWGFTLTDNGPDYIVLADSYLVATPVYGTYIDYIANQFYVAGPAPESPVIVSPWDQATQSGTGEFDLYSTDPVYVSFSGTINVDYDLFSVDPNSPIFDPGSDFIGSGTFSENVTVNATPEPATWVLMLLPFAALMFLGLRRHPAGLRF